MKGGRQIIFSILILIISLSSAYPKDEGTTSGVLLSFPYGAKSASLAEAYTAAEDDLLSLYYNPSTLTTLKKIKVALLYQKGIFEDNFGLLAIGIPLRKVSFGVGFVYYNAGEIELLDTKGNIKNLNAQRDYLFSFTISKKLLKGVSLGLTSKFLSSTLVEKFTTTAFAFDVGVLLKGFNDKLVLGASYKNIGEGIRYHKKREPLPTQKRLGLLLKILDKSFHRLYLYADTVVEEKQRKHLGIEYSLKNTLYLRAGYRWGYDLERYSAGLGFRGAGFLIDYAFTPTEDFGAYHKASLTFSFGAE